MLNKGTYTAALFVEQSGEVKRIASKTVKLTGKESIISYLDNLCKEMAEENLFIKVKNPGISHCFIGGGIASTFREVGSTESQRGQCIIKPGFKAVPLNELKPDFGENSTPEFDEDGRIYVTHLGLELYPQGYIISTGAKVYGILGDSSDAYVASLSIRRDGTHLKSGNRNGAKLYAKATDVLKFFEKYENDLRWFVTNRGMHFGYEKACDETDDTERAPVHDDIDKVLARINEGTPVQEVPVVVLGETQEEEALMRMRELRLMGVTRNHFRNGKLMQSEAGGILFDLDETAQKAVDMTKEYGVPYHVIKNGPMYSVLYVSKHKEEWESDRYNPADPYVYANVYNADGDFDEIGLIGVQPVNGGLVRTA